MATRRWKPSSAIKNPSKTSALVPSQMRGPSTYRDSGVTLATLADLRALAPGSALFAADDAAHEQPGEQQDADLAGEHDRHVLLAGRGRRVGAIVGAPRLRLAEQAQLPADEPLDDLGAQPPALMLVERRGHRELLEMNPPPHHRARAAKRPRLQLEQLVVRALIALVRRNERELGIVFVVVE